MKQQFSEENIELIQQYIAGSLSEIEKTQFETQLEKDEGLQKLVADYRLMKEGFELSKLQKKRERLKNIKALSEVEIKVEKEDTPPIREIRQISYKSILSYAAMLIPGLLLGWFLFNSPRENNINYGGDINETVVLLDQPATLLKIYQISSENTNALISTTDTSQIDLIISEMDTTQTIYTLDEQTLEIIVNKQIIEANNLGEANIQIILERLTIPTLEIALLKVNQQIIQIPLTNEDFNTLYQ